MTDNNSELLGVTTQEQVSTFPEEWKDEFEGLMYIGHLEREVTDIPFHKFVVKTLNINDKLEVSLLCKPYLELVGYNRAYRAAVVAAALISVDGRELVATNKSSSILREKYDYVVKNWHDSVIDILFMNVEELEGRVIEVLKELGFLERLASRGVFQDEQSGDDDSPKDGK